VPVPATPPGTSFSPLAAPVPVLPQGPVVQGGYTAPPTAGTTPAPQEATVRLSPPETTEPAPPQSAEPPVAATPPGATPPAVTERRDPPPAAVPAAPVDIPQFTIARDRVATGLRPFPDGVAWLKERGYRAVLHVRAPGADDAAARRQFEKYGLRYLTLDAEPRTLTKEAVDRFNRIVTDDANLPLFVYDKDASVAGGLWYLHFRLVEGATDEKARAEAARLGFRQEQDDAHRTMWIAVQKLLEANGR
jgi:hypothetical protein